MVSVQIRFKLEINGACLQKRNPRFKGEGGKTLSDHVILFKKDKDVVYLKTFNFFSEK